jgi:hypothetical protein
MKSIRNLSTLMVSCGIALAMVSTLAAQTVQGHATVVRINGSARYNQGGSWTPLKVGDVLRAGTVVQTGVDRGSYVDLVLVDMGSPAPVAFSTELAGASAEKRDLMSYQPRAEQNVVRLNENTALGIDRLTSQNTGTDLVTETQLDLKQGRITGNVKKLSPASKYEIKLPNGVAGIRGTVYDITAEGVVRVASGSMIIAYVGPNGEVITQIVNANQQFDARTGQLVPLSAGNIQWINTTLGQMIVRGPLQTTTFITDQTIFRVSPAITGN